MVLLAGLLVLFSNPVFAIALDVPQKTVAFAQWNFTTEFELFDSFDSARVLVDGQLVLSIASNFNYTLDPFNGDQIVSVSNIANQKKFVVSLTGLSAGNHLVVVETRNSAGEVLASKTATVLMVEPLDSSFAQSTDAQLIAMQNQNSFLTQELQKVLEENGQLKEQLASQNESIAKQQSQIQNLSGLLEVLRQNQGSTTELSQSALTQVQGIQSKLDAHSEQLQSLSNQTGLVSGISGPQGQFAWSFPTILGILILLAILGFTVFRHVQEKKVY